jgi:hypothetical protein
VNDISDIIYHRLGTPVHRSKTLSLLIYVFANINHKFVVILDLEFILWQRVDFRKENISKGSEQI